MSLTAGTRVGPYKTHSPMGANFLLAVAACTDCWAPFQCETRESQVAPLRVPFPRDTGGGE